MEIIISNSKIVRKCLKNKNKIKIEKCYMLFHKCCQHSDYLSFLLSNFYVNKILEQQCVHIDHKIIWRKKSQFL
jgi:hypothetical protein